MLWIMGFVPGARRLSFINDSGSFCVSALAFYVTNGFKELRTLQRTGNELGYIAVFAALGEHGFDVANVLSGSST